MPPSPPLSVLLRSLRPKEATFQKAIAQTAIRSRSTVIRWNQIRHETSTSFERYGSAKDLLLPPPEKPDATTASKASSADTKQQQSQSQQQPQASSSSSSSQPKKDADTQPEKLDKKDAPPPTSTAPKVQDAVTLDAAEAHPPEHIEPAHLDPTDKPLEKVLQMPAPTALKRAAPPHLEAPQYVHHFDTYTLVNDLQKGGFSQDQSTTIMKAVRSLLADNLDLAKEGLVSKSDVENESYLFRAACSEMRTEIQNTRRLNAEKMRSERALLQHEVDILSQKVTQESLNLKDELKGLFDDRKMAARMEQRGTDSQIQEIHYKITSVMAGEAKSEVEGLRWYLTRMLVFTLAGTVLVGITYLSFSTRRAHKEQERMKKAFQESSAGGHDSSTSYTTPSRSTGTQTAQTDAMLAEIAAEKGTSGGSGYVSLG